MSKEKTSLQYLKYADNFKAYKAGETIFKENDPGLFCEDVRFRLREMQGACPGMTGEFGEYLGE